MHGRFYPEIINGAGSCTIQGVADIGEELISSDRKKRTLYKIEDNEQDDSTGSRLLGTKSMLLCIYSADTIAGNVKYFKQCSPRQILCRLPSDERKPVLLDYIQFNQEIANYCILQPSGERQYK